MDEEEQQIYIKSLHKRKTDVFMDFIQGGDMPLRPGVLRIVDAAISAGLKLAVCSTSNELAVRNLVQSTL
jgi:phosphoserine phosphatase